MTGRVPSKRMKVPPKRLQVPSKRLRMPIALMSNIMKVLQSSHERVSFKSLWGISNCKVAPLAVIESRSRCPSSYGCFLNSTERLHYSRLCYLLLDEEIISPELRKDIVDALGTSKEKEEFYAQYEMTDKLITLYIDDLDDYEKGLNLLKEIGRAHV